MERKYLGIKLQAGSASRAQEKVEGWDMLLLFAPVFIQLCQDNLKLRLRFLETTARL